jgi:hypothetical protein
MEKRNGEKKWRKERKTLLTNNGGKDLLEQWKLLQSFCCC